MLSSIEGSREALVCATTVCSGGYIILFAGNIAVVDTWWLVELTNSVVSSWGAAVLGFRISFHV